jgi:DNA-binding response OmpR family regulator
MRVLLVEDEVDLGAAIERVLTREKYIVDWVQDGTTAWDYLDNPTTHYILAVLDWMLPGMTGIELCQRLRAKRSPLPVLILTARDSIEDRVVGLDAGADDYLVKPFGMAELLARLRALQRRSMQVPATQLQVSNLLLDYGKSEVFVQGEDTTLQAIPLTAKEFQLLEYFMKHPDQILTREQIENRLWDLQAEPTSNVVAAQVRLLRRKLAKYHCEGLIETVYGLGYRLNLAYASE